MAITLDRVWDQTLVSFILMLNINKPVDKLFSFFHDVRQNTKWLIPNNHLIIYLENWPISYQICHENRTEVSNRIGISCGRKYFNEKSCSRIFDRVKTNSNHVRPGIILISDHIYCTITNNCYEYLDWFKIIFLIVIRSQVSRSIRILCRLQERSIYILLRILFTRL